MIFYLEAQKYFFGNSMQLFYYFSRVSHRNQLVTKTRRNFRKNPLCAESSEKYYRNKRESLNSFPDMIVHNVMYQDTYKIYWFDICKVGNSMKNAR